MINTYVQTPPKVSAVQFNGENVNEVAQVLRIDPPIVFVDEYGPQFYWEAPEFEGGHQRVSLGMWAVSGLTVIPQMISADDFVVRFKPND